MAQIIPVINDKTSLKIQAKLSLFKDYHNWLQLDIADGKFTTWKNFTDIPKIINLISKLKVKAKWEVHLMVKNNLKIFQDLLALRPKRIIFHYEALNNDEIFWFYRETKRHHIEMGIALVPETPVEAIVPYLQKIKFVLLLGVTPGPSGQVFHGYVLDKVKYLKKKYPGIKVELDGGIDEEIAKKAIENKVDYLAMGSLIFDSPQPWEKFQVIKQSLGIK